MGILADEFVVRVTDGLIQGEVDGHPYVFSPRGYCGVLPLWQQAYDVVIHCSRGNSVSSIKRSLPWARTSPGKLIDIMISLAKCGILNLGKEFSQHLAAQRALQTRRSMTVWLQMTDSCNLRCSYCYVSKRPTHMDIGIAKTLISKIAKECQQAGYDSIRFKFAGGEPTIRWTTIKELIDWARSDLETTALRISFLILTNGTFLPPDLIDYVVSGMVDIAISLDGVEQWHDKHRSYQNGNGSFHDVDKNIELLLERGVNPSISSTITRDNVKGLTELAEYCVQRNLRFRFSPYRRPFTSQADLKSENTELIYELKRCYEWLECHLPARSLYEIHRFADIDLKTPKARICGVGVNTVAITSEGKASLCQFDMDNPIGNGLENNVLQLLKDQKRFPVAQNRVEFIPTCQDCKWRFTCAAGCPYLAMNQYGVFRHASPYCEVYQAILPVLLRLHAVQLLRAGGARPSAIRPIDYH